VEAIVVVEDVVVDEDGVVVGVAVLAMVVVKGGVDSVKLICCVRLRFGSWGSLSRQMGGFSEGTMERREVRRGRGPAGWWRPPENSTHLHF